VHQGTPHVVGLHSLFYDLRVAGECRLHQPPDSPTDGLLALEEEIAIERIEGSCIIGR
jgi:hypothetical protein